MINSTPTSMRNWVHSSEVERRGRWRKVREGGGGGRGRKGGRGKETERERGRREVRREKGKCSDGHHCYKAGSHGN